MNKNVCTRCIKVKDSSTRKCENGFYCSYHKKYICDIEKCDHVNDFQLPFCNTCEVFMKLLAVKRTWAAYGCDCGAYKNIIFGGHHGKK